MKTGIGGGVDVTPTFGGRSEEDMSGLAPSLDARSEPTEASLGRGFVMWCADIGKSGAERRHSK